MAHGPDIPRARRLGVLLEAALLALSLFAAPALHRKTCNGVCAEHRQAASEAEPAHSCCGGAAEHAEGPKEDGGCQCLDDCCAIVGCCAAPDDVCDTAPPSLVSTDAQAWYPEWTPRAPEARLLPYPTGPPPAA